ncbi:MAG: class I SAM-dependent methyltransferase [Thaumarchaeota archaeon]|nr:class I SAM-dependent methyltransferase [Nitrososphaerota archaeon]
MECEEIDFIQELTLTSKAYDGKIGRWWGQQTDNRSHAYAYSNIANYIRSFLQNDPSLILDYACGPGNLLPHLLELFPNCQFIGMDVSALMLELAKKRLARLGTNSSGQVELIRAELPDFSLLQGKASVVIFCFPQILWDSDQKRYDENGYMHGEDTEVAKFLAASRRSNTKDAWTSDDAQMLLDSLLRGKVVSRNLRGLLKKGGICVRVEYGKAGREKLTELEQCRLAFEEGSLEKSMNGRKAEKLFAFISSTYFQSEIMEDVYYQTKDDTDRKGGYSITMLEAV